MSMVATRKPQQRGSRVDKKALSRAKFYSLLRLRKWLRWLDSSFVSSVRCSLFYAEYKHKSSEEKRYKSIGCNDRATCPICGASYWKEKRGLAKSLFLAQRDKLMLEGSDLSQWLLDFEFTIPVVLSRLIDSMPLEGKRQYLNKLSRASYSVIADVLIGNDLVEKAQEKARLKGEKLTAKEKKEIKRQAQGNIGGAIAIHFWHSKNPLSPHYHWHEILSPYDSSGKLILEDPYLPKGKLQELRDKWREAVSDIFSIGFRRPFDVHYKYVKEGEDALSKFHHRFNYCFRHWTEDLLKIRDRGKLKKKTVGRAVRRARELQGIKTIRWFGYLSPVKRKKVGFEAIEYKDETFVCPRCGEAIEKKDLIEVLIVGLGWVFECSHCGEQFKEEQLKKESAWEKTGRTFVLKHFHFRKEGKEGVVLAEWDDSRAKVKKNSDVLVPYEKITFYPFKGKKKRFICRNP